VLGAVARLLPNLDLGREGALESLERPRLSGLRVADELADVLLRDPNGKYDFTVRSPIDSAII
jgi:hypothetical protein